MIIFARIPFKRLISPGEYNPGKLDQQFIRVEQAMPASGVVRVSAAYEVTTADRWVSADTTSGNFAVTLPMDPKRVAAIEVTITNVGTGTLTVSGTVSGSVNPTLTQWHSMTVVGDGVRYIKTAAV